VASFQWLNLSKFHDTTIRNYWSPDTFTWIEALAFVSFLVKFPNPKDVTLNVRMSKSWSNVCRMTTCWAGAVALASFSNLILYFRGVVNEIKRASPYPGGPIMSFCVKKQDNEFVPLVRSNWHALKNTAIRLANVLMPIIYCTIDSDLVFFLNNETIATSPTHHFCSVSEEEVYKLVNDFVSEKKFIKKYKF